MHRSLNWAAGPGRAVAEASLSDHQAPCSTPPQHRVTIMLTVVVFMTVTGAAARQWCLPRDRLCVRHLS